MMIVLFDLGIGFMAGAIVGLTDIPLAAKIWLSIGALLVSGSISSMWCDYQIFKDEKENEHD